MPLNTDLTTSLRQHFGFDAFRAGQEDAVRALLNDQHILVVMPTGSGKSLIFQLAALLLGERSKPAPVTLVISPLIALMKDQVDSLERRGIPATFINSAISARENSLRMQKMTAGEYRIVYVAPERLRSLPFVEAVRGQKIGLLAVDEAHCTSEWGHDFRPDYLNIAEARKMLARSPGNSSNGPLTAALTATATPQVQDDIIRLLGLPASTTRIVTGFNRPNLALQVRYTSTPQIKLRVLKEMLAEVKQGAAIVYTGTRRDAEEIAEFTREVAHLRAEHYHAGLDTDERSRIQDAFMRGNLNVIAATNAFGMGIDRPDVRLVVHYSLPGSLEAYYQEAGRAGRDGLPARAVLFYEPKDCALQEWFIEMSKTTPDDLHALYNALPEGRQSWILPEELSRRTSFPEVKLKLALAELERAGALQHLGDEGIRMLLVRSAWNMGAITTAIQHVQQRLAHRQKQLDKMVNYAESNACRRRILLDHFGDLGPADAPSCCDNCGTKTASKRQTAASPRGEATHAAQPASAIPTPGGMDSPQEILGAEANLSQRAALIVLDAVRRLHYPVGRQKLAQILKGSNARDIQRFGYNKSTYYARFDAFPQGGIENMIEQLIELGYLKVVGGKYPVLNLTPQGLTVIQERRIIPLDLPRQAPPKALANKKAAKIAGGTVAYTGQLFSEGLTPAEIAQHRGVAIITVFNHLAQLIAAGEVDVTAVVPADVRQQIEAAIQKVGALDYLSPLKAILPAEIDFSLIRCVVEGWKRKNNPGLPVSSVASGPDSTKPEPAASDEITAAILESVRLLPGQLPRSGVAKLLVGSDSERVHEYRQHPLFNRLAGHSRAEVLARVDHLLAQGQIDQNEDGHLMLVSSLNKSSEYTQRVVSLGNSKSVENVSELIQALERPDGNIRRLAASALGKIGDDRATEPLIELLKREDKQQVRQYIVKALGKIGGPRAKDMLQTIVSDKNEKDYTRASARIALKQISRNPSNSDEKPNVEDDVSAFLSHAHPRPLHGPWKEGWALGFHSSFSGDDWNRSPVGELAYRLKYQNDLTALPALLEQTVALLEDHPNLIRVNAIVPVPPSTPRPNDPVRAFAEGLAEHYHIHVQPAVVKTRQTAPQKEFHTLAQKLANVAKAFAVQELVDGQHLLVVDDLFDSGATLQEITRVLQRAGAASVYVLTLTRTIHSDA